MRTQVEFRSAKFPAYEGEEEQVNPGVYGRRLAEHLRTRLRERGIETGDLYAEDWGWAVTLPGERFRMWLGCGRYEEYEDGFLCFIEPHKPFVRRWFRKTDTQPAVERVAAALDTILRGDADIHDVRWWSEDESRRRFAR